MFLSKDAWATIRFRDVAFIQDRHEAQLINEFFAREISVEDLQVEVRREAHLAFLPWVHMSARLEFQWCVLIREDD